MNESDAQLSEMNITDYGEKAFVVGGNTKPFKDNLKKLGGRFNPKLETGPGWIFSNKYRTNVDTYLSTGTVTEAEFRNRTNDRGGYREYGHPGGGMRDLRYELDEMGRFIYWLEDRIRVLESNTNFPVLGDNESVAADTGSGGRVSSSNPWNNTGGNTWTNSGGNSGRNSGGNYTDPRNYSGNGNNAPRKRLLPRKVDAEAPSN